jgi:hypothetical protein
MLSWENILSISSNVLLLLTVTLLLVNYKEGKYAFAALAFYFLQIIIINLMSIGYLPASKKVAFYGGIWNNLLDAPLMLIGLLYFAENKATKKIILYLLGAFVVFECIVYAFTGLGMKMLTIIIGPGLLLVLCICGYFFLTHVKSSFKRSKDTGKAFITGSLLFAYTCFNFIYLLYYVLDNKNKGDLYKIYHLTYIIVAICISIGLVIIMKEKKKKPIPESKVKQDDLNAFQYL